MFSVVTVVKEDAEGLARTRVSLESQTFVDWTHVIVPASSEDQSFLLAQNWVGVKTVLQTQVGAGIYSAMNQGLARAQDEYVVFLNAGDLFADGDSLYFVAKSLRVGHPNWAVFGGFVKRGATTVLIIPSPGPSPWLVGCGGANILHPSVYYRKDFLLRLGGYEEKFRIAGDLDLNIRASQADPPQVFAMPVSVFFANGISSTQTFSTIYESFQARRLRLDGDWQGQVRSAVRMVSQLLRAGGAGLMRFFLPSP